MKMLTIIIILSAVAGVWWLFSTFSLLDIITGGFVMLSVVFLSICAAAILVGGGVKNG